MRGRRLVLVALMLLAVLASIALWALSLRQAGSSRDRAESPHVSSPSGLSFVSLSPIEKPEPSAVQPTVTLPAWLAERMPSATEPPAEPHLRVEIQELVQEGRTLQFTFTVRPSPDLGDLYVNKVGLAFAVMPESLWTDEGVQVLMQEEPSLALVEYVQEYARIAENGCRGVTRQRGWRLKEWRPSLGEAPKELRDGQRLFYRVSSPVRATKELDPFSVLYPRLWGIGSLTYRRK